METLFYTSAHQMNAKGKSVVQWRELKLTGSDGYPISTWDHIRYVLEENAGLQKKERAGYLTGVLRGVWTAKNGCIDKSDYLTATSTLSDGDCVVLSRHPTPAGLLKYVPERFDIEVIQAKLDAKQSCATPTFSEHLTEDDKISLMQQHAKQLVTPTFATVKRTIKHPSEYNIVDGIAVPDMSYVCKGCSEVGKHFRRDCPNSTSNTEKRHADRVTVPHGIPKVFLKKVVDAAERGPMKTSDGDFVVNDQTNVMKTLELVPAPSIQPGKVKMAKKSEKRKRQDHTYDFDFDFEEFLTHRDFIEETKRNEYVALNPKPKFNSMCVHWLRGLCSKGPLLCEFLHVYDESLWPICSFFVKGACLNIDCTFRHQLPPSLNKPPCLQFAKGFCAKGSDCYYKHVKRIYPDEEDFGTNERMYLEACSNFDNIFAAYKLKFCKK